MWVFREAPDGVLELPSRTHNGHRAICQHRAACSNSETKWTSEPRDLSRVTPLTIPPIGSLDLLFLFPAALRFARKAVLVFKQKSLLPGARACRCWIRNRSNASLLGAWHTSQRADQAWRSSRMDDSGGGFGSAGHSSYLIFEQCSSLNVALDWDWSPHIHRFCLIECVLSQLAKKCLKKFVPCCSIKPSYGRRAQWNLTIAQKGLSQARLQYCIMFS